MKKHSVSSLRMVDDITGYGHTHQWDVWGTDLGHPVYSPSQQRMYFLFGDTFSPEKSDEKKIVDNKFCGDIHYGFTRNWRGTIAGYITDFDVSNGFKWAGFLSDKDGNARGLIDSYHTRSFKHFENTKIAQGGVEIDGALYVFYESIRDWDSMDTGFGRSWRVNYMGVIKSTDGGDSFERVYDLTWVEYDQGEYADLIKRLATEDMDLKPSGFDLDLSTHVGPGFAQTCAIDGKDGYIYIYGRRGGRQTGIKVGRVKKEKIETFAEYEYLTKYENGEPVWVKGQEGLRLVHENEPESDIVKCPCSNMSVHYNAYLQKWVLTFYRVKVGVMYAVSETPYGVYSEPEMLISIDEPMLQEDNPTGGNVLYGGFVHELLNKEGGKKMMVIISQLHEKFYNSKLVEVTFD